MKTSKVVLLVVVSLMVMGTILFFINKSNNDSAETNVFKAIPADSEAIAVINLEAFMTLFFSNIGDIWELSEDFKDNKNAEEFQKEVQNSGINLSRKIALFIENERYNILVPLSNVSDFTSYLDNLSDVGNVSKNSNREYYHHEMEALIIFNDDICLVSHCKKGATDEAKTTWASIMENSVSEAPLSPVLEKLKASEEHFSFYLEENGMASRSPVFAHSPQNISNITFEDGRIKMTSIMSTENKEVSNPLVASGNSDLESEYFSCHISIDPSAEWDYWLTKEALLDLKEEFVPSQEEGEFIQDWGGVLNFSLTGMETAVGEVITYDYDENFEPIEKTEIKEYERLGYLGNVSFKGNAPQHLDISEVIPDQKSYSKTEGSELWISSKEEINSYSTRATNSIHLKANPGNLIDLAIDLGFPMAIMAKRFSGLTQDIEFTAIPVDKTIESELIITIPDEDKNSLIYIIGELQKVNF